MVSSEKALNLFLILLTLHTKLHCGAKVYHFTMCVNEWVRIIWEDRAGQASGSGFLPDGHCSVVCVCLCVQS